MWKIFYQFVYRQQLECFYLQYQLDYCAYHYFFGAKKSGGVTGVDFSPVRSADFRDISLYDAVAEYFQTQDFQTV